MTTEPRQVPRDRVSAALVRTACATTVLGLAMTLVAALTGGTSASYGAALGTLLVVAVFGFGTFTVNAVATLVPSASLLVALLTYTLQLVALALVLAMLAGSDLLGGTVDRGWVGGTVIVCTLGWMAAQVVLSTRLRIPIYDLPEASPAPVQSARGEG